MHAAGRHVTVLPTVTGDQLATAVVVLDYLAHVHLGPRADAESVATSLDRVAESCSPHRDLAVNPAKMLAIAMADTNPLVWGGSVLAARRLLRCHPWAAGGIDDVPTSIPLHRPASGRTRFAVTRAGFVVGPRKD